VGGKYLTISTKGGTGVSNARRTSKHWLGCCKKGGKNKRKALVPLNEQKGEAGLPNGNDYMATVRKNRIEQT